MQLYTPAPAALQVCLAASCCSCTVVSTSGHIRAHSSAHLILQLAGSVVAMGQLNAFIPIMFLASDSFLADAVL